MTKTNEEIREKILRKLLYDKGFFDNFHGKYRVFKRFFLVFTNNFFLQKYEDEIKVDKNFYYWLVLD